MYLSSLSFDDTKIWVPAENWTAMCGAESVIPILSTLAAAAEGIKLGGAFIIFKKIEGEKVDILRRCDGIGELKSLIEEVRTERVRLGLPRLP